jgi:hypothetical protein
MVTYDSFINPFRTQFRISVDMEVAFCLLNLQMNVLQL